jgi:hypothetical protein
MLERFVIRPGHLLSRMGGRSEGLIATTRLLKESIEIELQYCDDRVVVVIPLVNAQGTERQEGHFHRDNVVSWSISGNNVADDGSRAGAGGRGASAPNSPVNLQTRGTAGQEMVPVVTTSEDISMSSYLGLNSNNIENMEFMWRIWYALLQLRQLASNRAYNAPLDRVVGFGKMKNKTFFELPVNSPGYCQFILKSKNDKSSQDFIKLYDWLVEHFYRGAFTIFE